MVDQILNVRGPAKRSRTSTIGNTGRSQFQSKLRRSSFEAYSLVHTCTSWLAISATFFVIIDESVGSAPWSAD